ncbi:hypothetical protein [Dyadobacter sp. 3J3]|uniref:hypothetical protein n=1 Tax=Dyadobacter sp. 3J3 TaxID=2606600 RepID=UPI0038D4EE85
MATNIVTPFSRRNFLAASAGIITTSIFSPFSIALGKSKERLGIALVGWDIIVLIYLLLHFKKRKIAIWPEL